LYTLHIANKNYSSWSLRPWVLMRALQIPFEEIVHPFSDDGNRDAFRKFSPTAKVPCLIDGDLVVWDSMAIAEYLAETHSGVWPGERDARCWARCASAEMHSGFTALRGQCSMTCGVRVRLDAIDEPLRADIARIDEIWAEGRSRFGGPCLAGPGFTAADAFFAPVVFRAQSYGFSLSEAAAAYAEFLLGHPAMQEWYEAALAEPWRDAAHEAEIAAAGTVLADFRLGTA